MRGKRGISIAASEIARATATPRVLFSSRRYLVGRAAATRIVGLRFREIASKAGLWGPWSPARRTGRARAGQVKLGPVEPPPLQPRPRDLWRARPSNIASTTRQGGLIFLTPGIH
jgi:hypothetical protein